MTKRTLKWMAALAAASAVIVCLFEARARAQSCGSYQASAPTALDTAIQEAVTGSPSDAVSAWSWWWWNASESYCQCTSSPDTDFCGGITAPTDPGFSPPAPAPVGPDLPTDSET